MRTSERVRVREWESGSESKREREGGRVRERERERERTREAERRHRDRERTEKQRVREKRLTTWEKERERERERGGDPERERERERERGGDPERGRERGKMGRERRWGEGGRGGGRGGEKEKREVFGGKKSTKTRKTQKSKHKNQQIDMWRMYFMHMKWCGDGGGVGGQQIGTQAPTTTINRPKPTGQSRCRKFLALFCLYDSYRSKNKSHSTPGFTPWVGAGRRDSYQLLVTLHQSQSSKYGILTLLGSLIGSNGDAESLLKIFQNFF